MTGTIRPAKLSDAIAEHLEALILDGVLRPGEKLLPERDLALKLDVSRPSLRDALAKLEERGLLVTGRGGTHVARFLSGITDPLAAILHARPETTFDYFEFRTALEGLAAGLAAERANDLDRDAIRAIAARMRAAHAKGDPTEEADCDADLHLALYEAAHNVVILHVMRAMSDMLRQDVFFNRTELFVRPGVRDLLLDQHLAIADAVLAGDAAAARTHSEAHITFTAGTLRDIRAEEARREVSLRRIGRAELVDEGTSK
ncbi:FCD domain-containing protein [Azospirillum sp. RWY-5-1]|uniref:Pyruvate dehydrogenase complex repressor n=1 Tax=Azospirillum oleiclasticum TaxID=2735135 RepID=A0ABX2T362_9PROT|nr:FCD domain-containing protein [Azospirillum oleiclasticum]NYZ11493.1 FCD domain-containing protein [Azospirillum oleiclasticum]NYZ18654.1 FCD domain-containing protein [Azospirillum oleiclasticum]